MPIYQNEYYCRWYKQHETLDRLNIQAHKNAMATTDEFVMETFVTFDKVSESSSLLSFFVAQNCYLRLVDD